MAVLDWDPTPYPDPRKNRRGATISSDPSETPEVIAPVVLNFAYHIMCNNAAHRGIARSRVIRGPALLRRQTIHWQLGSTVGQPAPMIAMLYSEADGPASGIYLNTQAVPGTPVVEQTLVRVDGTPPSAIAGFVPYLSTTNGTVVLELATIVRFTEFRVFVVFDMRSNATGEAAGVVQIFEQIDPRYLGRFMV